MIVIIMKCGMVFGMWSISSKSRLLGVAFAVIVTVIPQLVNSAPVIGEGAGMVVVPLDSAAPVDVINVWYYRPQNSGQDVPIIFVLHGLSRNADKYRDNWIDSAEAGGFVVLAPEFQKQHFPSSWEYNLGNVMTRPGQLNPKDEWSFSIIESVFDQIVLANAFKAGRYDMYGHSAGAQFVHRYMFFMPSARVRTAVAANAGWYTLPDQTIDFPYGLHGSGMTIDHIEKSFSRDLVVLLGTEDNDPNSRHLRKTPEAMAQGVHRLARGENFFLSAKNAAQDIKSPFEWRLEYASGIGHSNRKIAPEAARYVGYPLNATDTRK